MWPDHRSSQALGRPSQPHCQDISIDIPTYMKIMRSNVSGIGSHVYVDGWELARQPCDQLTTAVTAMTINTTLHSLLVQVLAKSCFKKQTKSARSWCVFPCRCTHDDSKINSVWNRSTPESINISPIILSPPWCTFSRRILRSWCFYLA